MVQTALAVVSAKTLNLSPHSPRQHHAFYLAVFPIFALHLPFSLKSQLELISFAANEHHARRS
jgi:hypothetical protein